MPADRLHYLVMERIAVAAMDEQLRKASISKAGLFLMGHPGSISTGQCVFEYAWHKPDNDVPFTKVRAYVDIRSGNVTTELHPHGILT